MPIKLSDDIDSLATIVSGYFDKFPGKPFEPPALVSEISVALSPKIHRRNYCL